MLLEAGLLLRFVLKLLQANPLAGFTSFIYGLTSIFTAPFEAVFRNARIEGSVFEWTTLLAMFIYWLAAWALIRLFAMGRPVSTMEAQAKLSEEDR
jgi:hypothetical protein